MIGNAPSIHVNRDQNHLAWDPAIEPVASVASGEIVEFDCLDASNGELTADSTTESLATLNFDRVDQVTGPVEVEGAEPGDTLQIDLLEFEHADWGWTANISGFGLLADEFPDGFYKVTRLQPGARHAEFWPGITLPLAPFCGEIGVAPRTGPLSTIPPDVHGGNMDTRHLVAGSTLFLPVFHTARGCPWATATPRRATARCAAPPSRRPCASRCGSPSARTCASPAPSSSSRRIRTPNCATGSAMPPMASVQT
jgi:acetamidase/formamidase